MAKKKSTPSKKARFTAYKVEDRQGKNREKRLTRHIKNHPNDVQAEKASTRIKYRRKRPTGLGVSTRQPTLGKQPIYTSESISDQLVRLLAEATSTTQKRKNGR